MTPPALLAIRAVAHRLSVSASTVERLIASGELEAVRVRRSIRATPVALDAIWSRVSARAI
jgi:excisionase family DNA binding protein